ncbi:MAG: flagellar hook-basal body complex protein FliE [Armatimonadetes bacterium]|jgi:flagellar hook-basal body complex protein FliE|nr:flagellar hook-basal body complex protein FliE [Armatimonadota bacterium]
MRINAINQTVAKAAASIRELDLKRPETPKAEAGGDVSASFAQSIKKAVDEVNGLQKQADNLAVNMASGDVEDVHKAMIAMQKAKLALDFSIQVRNKVIEAYQEIMRMQV